MRVLRYQFDVNDEVDLAMPEMAKLLRVREVGPHQIEMWALVNDTAAIARRRLRIAGTGHLISASDCGQYVGTTVCDHPRLVWHIFDLGEVLG